MQNKIQRVSERRSFAQNHHKQHGRNIRSKLSINITRPISLPQPNVQTQSSRQTGVHYINSIQIHRKLTPKIFIRKFKLFSARRGWDFYLPEREEDYPFDAQELSKRLVRCQLLSKQVIEYDQGI